MSDAEDNAAADAAKPARQWPFTLKLATPVVFGSATITELVFRKGTIGDGKGVKLNDEISTNELIVVASRLCGRPTNVVELLDVDDGGEAMGIALDFIGKFLARKKP